MDNQEILKSTSLFTTIDEKQLSELASHIEEVKFPKEAIVIKEGDRADCLYIIKEGALQAFTFDNNHQEIILARLEAGAFFGEQALLSETPGQRNANVRTLTDVTLLKVHHADFRKVIEKDDQLKKELKTVGIKHLINRLRVKESEFDISKYLLDDKESYEPKEFDAGQTIFTEGNSSDGIYLLLSGVVNVYKNDQLIRSIAPGNIFGEFGLIQDQPRSATIKAQTTVKTLFITSSRFKQLYQERPKLKEVADALQRIYQSPVRGEVTQYTGHFLHMPAAISKFNLKDGRELISTYVIGKNIRLLRESKIQNFKTFLYEDKTVYRELEIAEDGRVIGITAYGEWSDLKELYARVFDKGSLTENELENFKLHGDLAFKEVAPSEDQKQNVCNCMRVPRGTIAACISAGCSTVAEVSSKTGAGTVCGACIPQIESMLGHQSWMAMHILRVEQLTPDVRAYRLSPVHNKPLRSFKPGQHVVIQCQINGNWVERTYTLVSAPGNSTYYEVAIKEEEKGLFSRWLFAHGEEVPFLRTSTPSGNFTFDPTSTIPIICFTGGIGITPAVGFARAIVESNTARPLLIYTSARSKDHLAYDTELEALSKQAQQIKYFKHLTDEKGRMQSSDILKIVQQNPDAEFFICGPKGFQSFVKSTLQEAGITDHRIFIEEFTHAGGPPQ